jgi:hypothetical protein
VAILSFTDFLKEPYAFLAVQLYFIFMITISANLRHDNRAINDRPVGGVNKPKYDFVYSGTDCYVTACKALYWSHRLGDGRGTNFQEEACNSMRPFAWIRIKRAPFLIATTP